jgi:sarcosine oxidase
MTDVAVIGAGIVGLSTAYALAERGVSVTVYERGVPGNGQSGGEGRIFRHAHEDPRLVALAREARAVWDEWSERFGVEFVSPDGAVALGPSRGDVARRMAPDELAERLPVLAAYEGPAWLDERGGAIRTGAAITALSDALRGSLVFDEVLGVCPAGREFVEVRAGGGTREHGRAIVCAGRGTPRLARGAGIEIPARVTAHARLTFAVRDEPPARLATFQDGSGAFGETGVYGTPVAGNHRFSVGIGDPVDERGLGALAKRTVAYAERALPGLDPRPVAERHCWVTELPWGHDAIGVWDAEGVLAVFGNNLFKHAPALGLRLADAHNDGISGDLQPDARLGAAKDLAVPADVVGRE